jgi:hypothetical protein
MENTLVPPAASKTSGWRAFGPLAKHFAFWNQDGCVVLQQLSSPIRQRIFISVMLWRRGQTASRSARTAAISPRAIPTARSACCVSPSAESFQRSLW